MIVQRLLPAFCCALAIHLLIILVPHISENPLAPQLTGNTSIQINLASTSVNNIAPDIPNDEQEEEEVLKESPPEKKDITEDIPQEENSMLKEITEPILEEPETDIPTIIQAQSKNQLQQTETAVNPSPDSPKSENSATDITQSLQDNETAKIAAAAQVTAQTTPLYYKNPKPAYPALARKRNWQGTVVLAIMVLENGTVGQVTIHKSSGHEMLDNSALKTVKTWHFLPGMKNGIPVSMEVQVPILFKLD